MWRAAAAAEKLCAIAPAFPGLVLPTAEKNQLEQGRQQNRIKIPRLTVNRVLALKFRVRDVYFSGTDETAYSLRRYRVRLFVFVCQKHRVCVGCFSFYCAYTHRACIN